LWGQIKWKKDRVIIEGIDYGNLDLEYCESCGEEYFPEETMIIIEKKTKRKGFMGHPKKGRKSRSSVLLMIPKDIADKLKLKPDEKVTLFTEGKNKLIIST